MQEQDMIGKVVFEDWTVTRKIGTGSFGTVYELQRDLFGYQGKAALKVISIPQNSGDIQELYQDGYDRESITRHFESYLQELIQEYTLMEELKGHSNIVCCDELRYIQHDDGLGWDIYIKMELLTPLTEALGQEIPEEQVIKIARDLCNALILCRSRKIIHRDIKPQNIFVSRNGDYKLGDFGIAKTAERTASGTKTGTYRYMAPEVYHNQPYGSSADQYSLGLVLYWLLNERRTPFLPLPPQVPTASDAELARQRRFRGEALPQPKHGSPALRQIVRKACAFDPKDRYASAEEMKRDLDALPIPQTPAAAQADTEDETLPATSQARIRSQRKKSRRGRILAALVLLAFLAGGAILRQRRGESQLPVVQGPDITLPAATSAPAATEAAAETSAAAPENAPLPCQTHALQATAPGLSQCTACTQRFLNLGFFAAPKELLMNPEDWEYEDSMGIRFALDYAISQNPEVTIKGEPYQIRLVSSSQLTGYTLPQGAEAAEDSYPRLAAQLFQENNCAVIVSAVRDYWYVEGLLKSIRDPNCTVIGEAFHTKMLPNTEYVCQVLNLSGYLGNGYDRFHKESLTAELMMKELDGKIILRVYPSTEELESALEYANGQTFVKAVENGGGQVMSIGLDAEPQALRKALGKYKPDVVYSHVRDMSDWQADFQATGNMKTPVVFGLGTPTAFEGQELYTVSTGHHTSHALHQAISEQMKAWREAEGISRKGISGSYQFGYDAYQLLRDGLMQNSALEELVEAVRLSSHMSASCRYYIHYDGSAQLQSIWYQYEDIWTSYPY